MTKTNNRLAEFLIDSAKTNICHSSTLKTDSEYFIQMASIKRDIKAAKKSGDKDLLKHLLEIQKKYKK